MVNLTTVYPDDGKPDTEGDLEMAIPVPNTAVQFTWYATLKDTSYQPAYDEYRVKEYPVIMRYLITALLSLYYISGFVAVNVFGDDTTMKVIAGLGLLRPVFMLLYAYSTSSQLNFLNFNIKARVMGDITMLWRVLIAGAILVRSCQLGPCTGGNVSGGGCNPVHDQQELPPVHFAFLVCGTLFLPLIFRCHSAAVSYACVVLSFAAVGLSMTMVDADNFSYYRMACFAALQLLCAIHFEQTSAATFKTYASVEIAVREKITAEHEKNAIVENAHELRHFIGNVAHDLKTPLQAFVSELDCLGDDGVVTTQGGRNSLLSMNSTCHFMTMTINRSLDFIKCTSGFKLQPKAETVSLTESFQWVCNCVKLYAKKHMRISVQPIAPDICRHVITDKQWLLENLLCLASNSVKFVGEGGELCFRVHLDSVTQPGPPASVPALLFEVEDDGIGIPEDKMGALFQPFEQAQRNAGGTGLGLYALANRTQAIGGTYGVRPRLDGKRGVLFWFTVPYRPDRTVVELEEMGDFEDVLCCSMKEEGSPHTLDNDSVLSTSGGRRSSQSACRVLLVDDSIMIQKATARMLRRQGHVTDIANNGLECLHLIQEKSYDFILMDINMPVMDGLEAIRRIRVDEVESPKLDRNQFVIGVSADSAAETRKVAIASGMNDFLEKPLDMKRLKEKCLFHKIRW